MPETDTREPDRTLKARQQSRYLAMRRRAEKIADGAPQLTPAQYDELAAIFTAAARRNAGGSP